MARSNRLLDIFQSDVHRADRDPVPDKLCETGRSYRDPSQGGSTADLSRVATQDRLVGTGGVKKCETRLGRENARLKEQLKFQGAVLDQLAGDVHTLETEAVKAHRRPSSAHSSREAGAETSQANGLAIPSASDDRHAGATPAPARRTSSDSVRRAEKDESARLRSELREARETAENLRRDVAAERKAAGETGQSHVDLLSRERKFRAAVEAGLREKVHSIRRRSRDREKRLSAELSFVKAQLKETVDLLACKQEEACLASKERAEQEERAVAALARWKERDRHAHWLERRLAEVSSGEATSTKLCIEEMTAALVSQQRELETMRAAALKQARQERLDPRCEGSGDLRQSCDGAATGATRLGRDAESLRAATPITEEHAPDDTTPVGLDTNDKGIDAASQTKSETAGSDVQTDRSGDARRMPEELRSSGEGPDGSGGSMTHPATGGKQGAVSVSHECVGPDEPCSARLALHERSSSSTTGGATVACICLETMSSGASERGAARAEESRRLLEWLLSQNDQASPPPLAPETHQFVCTRVDLNALRSGILAALGTRISAAVAGGVSQEAGASLSGEKSEGGEWRRGAEWSGRADISATRAAVVLEEELTRLRDEGGEWEKEAVALRVERQTMVRRLRKLLQESEEKERAVSRLDEATSALKSELEECRERRSRLQREVSQQVQARRLLEKRATTAEASLSEAVASRAKAERASVLLKARLTGALRRGKSTATADSTSSAGGGAPSARCTAKPHTCTACGTTSVPGGSLGVPAEKEAQPDDTSSTSGGDRADRDGGRSRGEEGERELRNAQDPVQEPLAHVKRLEEQLQAAQDRSAKERQQSEQDVQHAQRRVSELEQAWQALAAKVVTLADRNADLEWAILKLRRRRRHSSEEPSHGASPARTPVSIATHEEGNIATREEAGVTTTRGDEGGDLPRDHPHPSDSTDVPRIRLDLDAIVAQQPVQVEGGE